MYDVCIIQSISYPNKIYKGSTGNLRKRLKLHSSGEVSATKKFRLWKIIPGCVFTDKQKALDFEKYLKTAFEIAFTRKRPI